MNVRAKPQSYEVSWEDVEYRRVDGEPLLARVYRPRGDGPFPALVSVHGGAWTSGDRLNNQVIDQELAAAGAVVAALDFRIAPAAAFPASVVDVNAGIRWLKANATRFGSRPDWVGAFGTSSGGHQVLLNVMQPRHQNYVAQDGAPAEQDAEVSYAIACWPISDPLARFNMAKARGNERLVKAHGDYFGSEAAMTEGNPQLLLERGEAASLPALLLLQGTKDDNVTPDMAQRFAEAYRKAGGRVTLELFEDQPHMFVTKEPTIAPSIRALELMKAFVLSRGAAA